MKYGDFNKDGSIFTVCTPNTPDSWYNYFFNKDYYVKVSQTGQGESTCLSPVERNYTRGYKYFYISDNETAQCWNTNFRPLKIEPDFYECNHSLGWTNIKSSNFGIESELTVFVPLNGIREIWIRKVKNKSDRPRSISLYTVFSFESAGMGVKCAYDKNVETFISFTYPYHIRYDEKSFCDSLNNYVYMFSDRSPNTFDCCEKRFFGTDDVTGKPKAVENGGCSNIYCENESAIGALEHKLTLLPGEEQEICFVMGCAVSQDEIFDLKKALSGIQKVRDELTNVNNYWEDICSRFVVNTPDKNLDYFINFWAKKQTIAMNECHRFSTLICVRNELQDAMGYSVIDIQKGYKFISSVLRQQLSTGYLQQWHILDDIQGPRGLALLKHKDALTWLISCTCIFIQQSGDISYLEQLVSYKDTGKEATVYDHLLKAVDYMFTQIGKHGMSLFGDGDWTDPINGAGRLGKGESTWTTMASRYALQQLLPFCKKKGDTKNYDRLKILDKQLEKAISDMCWDGNWYIAGYDDNGVAFGTNKEAEGKIYLNPQTWAIISKSAEGERLEKCTKTIDKLQTSCGSFVVWPPYTAWKPNIGKLSIKLPGNTENGGIYCHASMFAAYAYCLIGRGNEAYETIIKTLPTNPENPPDKNLQIPIYIPNYYFGNTVASPNFGRSSQINHTGTCTWLLWITVEHMLGAKSTIDGLEISPCIPEGWSEFSITKQYRNAKYNIKIKNELGRQSGVRSILVNGCAILGNILPYETGKSYEVEVIM